MSGRYTEEKKMVNLVFAIVTGVGLVVVLIMLLSAGFFAAFDGTQTPSNQPPAAAPASVNQALPAAAPASEYTQDFTQSPDCVIKTVAQGDTLWSMTNSVYHQVSNDLVAKVALDNRISPDEIFPGQSLKFCPQR